MKSSSSRTARCSIPARTRLRCSTTCGNWDRRTSRLMRTRYRRCPRWKPSTAISGGRSFWSPDRDQAAIKDVFVFVEDECEVRIRLLEDQSRGCGPAWFRAGGSVRTVRGGVRRPSGAQLRGTRLRWKNDPAVEGAPRFSLSRRPQHQGQCRSAAWDTSKAPPSQPVIRCNCCSEWPTGWNLFSIRSGERRAGPVSDETIQTALETCDAIRTLLGSLTHNGAGGPVSPELLGRLGVRSYVAPARQARGWAGSRVSQYDVAVRRDDCELFPAPGK